MWISVLITLFAPPVLAADIEATITKIYAGNANSCLVSNEGKVKCWGNNIRGQLGRGNTTAIGNLPDQMGTAYPRIDLGKDDGADVVVSQLSLDRVGGTVCALTSLGKIKCWGLGTNGALGYGSTVNLGDNPGEMGSTLPFLSFSGNPKATGIAVGGNFSCALFETGKVRCWGRGTEGQLGSGTTASQSNAALTADIDFGTGEMTTQIAAGQSHACGLFTSGRVKCWGLNTSGQLGQGNKRNLGNVAGELAAAGFVNLGNGAKVKKVFVGDNHSCAQLEDMRLICWGLNSTGQLGAGDDFIRGEKPWEMPVSLTEIKLGTTEVIKEFSAGTNFNCALFESGRLKCFGQNNRFQLGLGRPDRPVVGTTPADLTTLPWMDVHPGFEVESVATGTNHVCALIRGLNAIKCWGQNDLGSLGVGDNIDRGSKPEDMGSNLQFANVKP